MVRFAEQSGLFDMVLTLSVGSCQVTILLLADTLAAVIAETEVDWLYLYTRSTR